MRNGSLPAKPYWLICHLTKRQTSSAAMRRASISEAGGDEQVECGWIRPLGRFEIDEPKKYRSRYPVIDMHNRMKEALGRNAA